MSSEPRHASNGGLDDLPPAATNMNQTHGGSQSGNGIAGQRINIIDSGITEEGAEADSVEIIPIQTSINENNHLLSAGGPAKENGATEQPPPNTEKDESRPNTDNDTSTSTSDDTSSSTSSGDSNSSGSNENGSVPSPGGIIATSLPSPPPYEKLAQKNPKPTDHLSITIGPPVILLFDIVVPCIIYYVWFDKHRARWAKDCQVYDRRNEPCPLIKPEYDEEILGYAIIAFGAGELYVLIARVIRLIRDYEQCAPLISRSKWELDATSWVYGVSMICALIPFVVGGSLEIPQLYLYSPGFLMGFLGIVMVITLIPLKLPIGIDSQPRGTRMRPFIYYAAEDFIAVDGLQDREFRRRYNARYDSSKGFRRMFLVLTIWWIFGVLVYLGCLSAVIWTLEFHYAFGLSLGVLFAYLLIWALVSYYWVQVVMNREKRAFTSEKAKC
ncbi:beta-glucosidase 1 precursor protein [Rutstroemia sp. NJR-2017a BVV2]|nr:beta-glucosidase 1 precursor protein [Rutstroemia sp. NJR-2017a BVV2]